jgi:hypothetical protein
MSPLRHTPVLLAIAGVLAVFHRVTSSPDPAAAFAALLFLAVLMPIVIGFLVRLTPRESSGSIVPGRSERPAAFAAPVERERARLELVGERMRLVRGGRRG